MADVNCAPQYGFAYLDTTNDQIRLFYFEVSDLQLDSGLWGQENDKKGGSIKGGSIKGGSIKGGTPVTGWFRKIPLKWMI